MNMQEDTHHASDNTFAWDQVEPPFGLESLVFSRIARARIAEARFRAALLGALALCFGVALVPTLGFAARQLYASGFFDYASLLYSDNGLFFTSSRELLLSLLDSLPSLALLLVVVAGGGLVWSLRRAIPNARIAFTAQPQTA